MSQTSKCFKCIKLNFKTGFIKTLPNIGHCRYVVNKKNNNLYLL